MTNPEHLDIGESVELAGPGFLISLTRVKDSLWELRRGATSTGQLVASVTLWPPSSWSVTSPSDPGVVRDFPDYEATLRYALTR